MPRLSPDGTNEYVDMYISINGNRLLPNDGRNLNIFFIFKTTIEYYSIMISLVCYCILIHLLTTG